MSKRRLLITHIDLDGVGSVILAKWLECKGIFKFDDIWMVDYGFEDEEGTLEYVKSFDEIHIYDMSIPEDTLNSWTKLGVKVIIKDHHDSALWINKLNNGSVVDTSKCGTVLFLKWMENEFLIRIPRSIKEFVDLVDTYDRWLTDAEFWDKACNLNLLMFDRIYHDYDSETPLEACKPFIDHILMLFDDDPFKFSELDELIIDRNKKAIDAAYTKLKDFLVIVTDSKGRRCGISKLGSKISLAAHKFFTENPEYNLDYLIIVYESPYDGITGKVSVRTQRDDFDCTLLQNIEGHTQAAGGVLTVEECELLLKGLYSLKYKDEYVEGESVLD